MNKTSGQPRERGAGSQTTGEGLIATLRDDPDVLVCAPGSVSDFEAVLLDEFLVALPVAPLHPIDQCNMDAPVTEIERDFANSAIANSAIADVAQKENSGGVDAQLTAHGKRAMRRAAQEGADEQFDDGDGVKNNPFAILAGLKLGK